mgnify:CR=1 FL=1
MRGGVGAGGEGGGARGGGAAGGVAGLLGDWSGVHLSWREGVSWVCVWLEAASSPSCLRVLQRAEVSRKALGESQIGRGRLPGSRTVVPGRRRGTSDTRRSREAGRLKSSSKARYVLRARRGACQQLKHRVNLRRLSSFSPELILQSKVSIIARGR